jgi:ribonuclease P protein component
MGFALGWPPRAVGGCLLGAVRRAASASAPEAFAPGRPAIRTLKFEPRKRLHQPAEFRDVRQRGKRLSDAYFSLSVLPNHETYPRLGLAIATRSCATAVARNRIKRLTRESFRLNQHDLPPVDVTVAVREAARLALPGDLRASLAKHWHSIAQKW